jgi:hypothetical protein
MTAPVSWHVLGSVQSEPLFCMITIETFSLRRVHLRERHSGIWDLRAKLPSHSYSNA